MEAKLPKNLLDKGWEREIYCRACQKQVSMKNAYGDDEKQKYYCWTCWDMLRPKLQCNLCEKEECDEDFFPCHTDPHKPEKGVLCKVCHVRHMVRCDHRDCRKRLQALEAGEAIQTLKFDALQYI